MARTANIFTRVEPEVKDQTEAVLNQRVISFESMSKEQFDYQIQRGINSIENGRTYSADEVETEMSREFGL